jgi:hypothetical protein
MVNIIQLCDLAMFQENFRNDTHPINNALNPCLLGHPLPT